MSKTNGQTHLRGYLESIRNIIRPLDTDKFAIQDDGLRGYLLQESFHDDVMVWRG